MRSLHHLVVERRVPDRAGGLQLRRAYDHRGILSAVGLVVVQRPQKRYQGNENLYLSGLFAHATEASLHQACPSRSFRPWLSPPIFPPSYATSTSPRPLRVSGVGSELCGPRRTPFIRSSGPAKSHS